jgi:hypothetical protein
MDEEEFNELKDDKEYTVLTVKREDIACMYYGKFVETLTEEEMQKITKFMSQAFREFHQYEIALEFAVDMVKAERDFPADQYPEMSTIVRNLVKIKRHYGEMERMARQDAQAATKYLYEDELPKGYSRDYFEKDQMYHLGRAIMAKEMLLSLDFCIIACRKKKDFIPSHIDRRLCGPDEPMMPWE